MATKAGLLATINGFITAVVNIAKHRSSMSAVVDEIYTNAVVDSNILETYTTKSGTNILYEITIKKIGNNAFIKIRVKNTTSNILASQNIYSWKESEYKPKISINEIKTQAWQGSNRITIYLTNTTLSLVSDFQPSSQWFETDFITYITQD